MKYFVEAHTILKNRSGVGWYTHGLVKGMQSIVDKNDTIRLLTHPKEPMDIADLLQNKQTIDQPIDWLPPRLYHTLKHHNVVPPLDLVYGKGVYIFPNFIRWPLVRSPSVIVVHDLSMFLYKEYSSPANLQFMTRHLPRSIANANLIVAVSSSTKQVLCEQFNVSPDKVIVSLEAIDPAAYYPRTVEEIAIAKAKYGIFGKYLFFVSTLEPRKNVEGIIRAFRTLPKALRDEHSLVLVGGRGWHDEKIRKAIEDGRIAGDKIILPGYVDEEHLPALYSGAEGFVWPSHYEGFGIPILEAMACGVPVLTANNSSLLESAGEAALYVSSTSHEELLYGMTKLLTNQTLRKDLIAKGYLQVKKFSWQKSAQTVIDAIKSHNLA